MAGPEPVTGASPAAASGQKDGERAAELAEAEAAEAWLASLQEERQQLLSENERLQEAVAKAREMAQRKVENAKKKNDRLQRNNLKLKGLAEDARLIANCKAEAEALDVLDKELVQALESEADDIRKKVMTVLRVPFRARPGDTLNMTEPPTPVPVDILP